MLATCKSASQSQPKPKLAPAEAGISIICSFSMVVKNHFDISIIAID